MEQYLTAFLTTSFTMSIVILAFILFNRLLSGKYPAKWRYYIWLIIIACLLFPFRPNLGLPTQISVDNIADKSNEEILNTQNVVNSQSTLAKAQTPSDDSRSLTLFLFVIWLAGALITLVFQLWRHKRFIDMVGRWSVDIESQQLCLFYGRYS